MTNIAIDKNITETLEISSLPTEKQKEIVDKLENIILTELSAKVINELLPEDKEAYVKVLDSGNQEKIYNFLSDKILDFDSLVKEVSVETINKFKKEKS